MHVCSGLPDQESAVLRPDAAAVVREVARGANVFVITHVLDDIGEATVRGALEAGGLVGTGPGQVCISVLTMLTEASATLRVHLDLGSRN